MMPADKRPLPIDLMGGALVACSLDRITGNYAVEKAVDVVRASDGATKTIGFVDGKFDGAEAAEFLSGTTGSVSRWYDQSGRGNDLFQTIAASRPHLTYMTNIGWTINFVGHCGDPKDFRVLQATLATAINPSADAVFAMSGVARTTFLNNALLGLGGSSGWALYGSLYYRPSVSVNSHAASIPMPVSPAVVVFTQTEANTVVHINNTAGFCARSLARANQTELTIGLPEVQCETAFRTCIYYNRLWTDAEVNDLKGSLSALHNIPFHTLPDVVVCDGDSITYGLGAADGLGWCNQMQPMLARPSVVYNFGWPGRKVRDALETQSEYYARVYSSSVGNFVINLLYGINDLTTGRSANQTFADLRTYIANLRSLGGNVRVNVGTVLPRGGQAAIPEVSVNIATLNTLIRTNYKKPQAVGGLGADGLIDYASDPTLATCSTNPAICSDFLHPTTLGNTHMAALAAKATNTAFL